MKPTTTQIILLYGGTAITFLVIDLAWIGMVARGFYADQIGGMLGDRVNWAAALIFYGIYVGGIVLFVLIPALKNGSGTLRVMGMGGLLGLFAYGTFDLSALALFKNWPLIVAVVDIAWGSILTASTAAISHQIFQRVSTPD